MSDRQGVLQAAPPSISFRRAWPYIALCIALGFISFMGLSVLRLYSFRLECRLNSLNDQIDSFRAQEVSLRQELSAILSPGRVYSFSKEKLGMTSVAEVKTLRVDGAFLAAAPEGSDLSGVVEGHEGEQREGWFYFFLERASAKN